jgi:probable O-glycosylation ligase (exosortase A-associated)
MNTIGSANEDDSMMGRVAAWKISSAIALANPVFGGGIHAVEIAKVWKTFMDAPNLLWFVQGLGMNVLEADGRAAHSIYFETMGDLGFVGFGLFIALLINALMTGREVIHIATKAGPDMRWALDLAYAIMISVVAYSVGGALLSAAYFELPYILFMLLEVMKRQMRAELTKIEG